MKRIKKTIKTFTTRNLTIIFDKVDFTYTHLSWKRLITWFLAELAYVFKTERIWSYPTHIQIEPSNQCNLRCPLCHIVTDNKPRGMLNLNDFKKLIDEISDYILFLHFWGWGEPFLNKDFYKMIRYAKDKGIQIISSTNGHFFLTEKNIDRLIDSGLDVLIIAFDGIDPETYEKYRQKGDFERVLKGIKQLIKRRDEQKKKKPRINLRMLVTQDNENQVEQMKQLAKSLGIDIFSLKTLCSFDNEAKWKTLLPKNLKYRRFKYNDQGYPVRIENPCKKAWNHPTVYRDGTVVPCDYYTGEEFNLGNIFQNNNKSFKDIWFGESYQQFRKHFRKKESTGLRCENCSLNYANVDRCVSHAFRFDEPDEKC